jgi:hypothetical protein
MVEQFKYMLKTDFSLFFSVVLCGEQCLIIKFEVGRKRRMQCRCLVCSFYFLSLLNMMCLKYVWFLTYLLLG